MSIIEKIKREKLMINKRYSEYTEKELLGLILFELRGIGFKLEIFEKDNYLSAIYEKLMSIHRKMVEC